MSNFPYKNPISSIQVNGPQSVPRNNTYGTTFSVNNTGGYMEVFSLSDLYYTIPSGTTGSIEYSGNTIPIEFTKGTGVAWSPDVITLASDNISSGRRRLGMLAYVYEEDQVYQYYIDNYETLFNAATASTGCAQVSNFGTTINNKTAAGQLFINAWTGNTIEDVSGATYSTAVWRKFSSGSSSGGTSGDILYITGTGVNSTIRKDVGNIAKGDYGASLGGSGNTASGNYSFIGGGVGNTASGAYSFVGGGNLNTLSGNYSFVGGGVSNTSSNYFSTIAGGGFHTSSGFYSTISGGRCNTSSNYNTTVSGGYCNTSSGKYSTTGGGFKNNSSGLYSTIGGGTGNISSSNNSTIGGGAGNIASGTTSTVSGGYSNTSSGNYSFIGGGYCNTTSGLYSFIGGGTTNTSSGYYSFIGGGNQNTISGYPSIGPSFSSILNGNLNTISGTSKFGSYSVIIGGCNNFVSDSFIGVFGSNIVASCPNTFYTNDFCSCGSIYSSALSSGQAVCTGTNGLLTNYTPVSPVIIQGSCTTSSIRCGVTNNATADFSASLAGTGNTASGLASIVVGGAINNTYSVYSFVGGGVGNKSCGNSTSVVGGSLNTACCATSFIGGGQQNITSGVTSSVVGGLCNTAGGNCSFIGGGNLNTITSGGTFSIIGSGVRNTISGNHGSVLGGSGNTVTGSFSSAIGCGLNASANCTLYTNNIITGGFSATTMSSSTITTSFTTGSVIFQGSGGTLSQNNSNLFWNNTNSRLGICTTTPSTTLDVNGIVKASYVNTPMVYGSGDLDLASAGGTTGILIKNTTRNVILNSIVDAGYKLDVNGTARFTNYVYAQSGVTVGGTGGVAGVFFAAGSVLNRETVVLRGGLFPTDAGTDVVISNGQGDASITSGIRTLMDLQRGFNPTSGNGVFNIFNISSTINQLSGSSGVTRGIYVNPTLTSAYDYRAIQWPNNTGYGLYGSGSAPNYLQGNTLIGTTANTGTYKLDVRGATRFSATTGTSLTVISSGNSTSLPIFSVQGSQGELFSVTDSLTGSLFSVSDISGLPIMEVFSDSTTIIGDYQAPSLYTTKRVSSITATTGTTIYSFPTSAYTSSFVDYNVSGSTGLRAGNIMAIWSGTSVNFTETSTSDIGVTTPLTFGYVISGSSAVLQASASTGTWIVESIVRGL